MCRNTVLLDKHIHNRKKKKIKNFIVPWEIRLQSHLLSKISKVLSISVGENGKFPSQSQHPLQFWDISINIAEQGLALMLWLFHCLL